MLMFSSRGPRGREPPHVAARAGHVDVVEVLLGAKASMDAKESEFGRWPQLGWNCLFKKAAGENDTEKQYSQVASRSFLQYRIYIPLFERVACSVVAFIFAQQSFSNQSMKWYSWDRKSSANMTVRNRAELFTMNSPNISYFRFFGSENLSV